MKLRLILCSLRSRGILTFRSLSRPRRKARPIAPIIFTGLVAASWLLRPLARRDEFAGSAASSRSRAIAYWVTTGLLALECGVGGAMGALRLAPFSEIMKHLGYPAYFMTIIGVWYVLGAVALLVPRFPRLKEWAYAGMVFIWVGQCPVDSRRTRGVVRDEDDRPELQL